MSFNFRKFESSFLDITIGQSRISFATNKPPFEYLNIEYDPINKAIRFTKGDKNNGWKVGVTNNTYGIQPRSFLTANLLPRGKYRKISDLTYQLKEAIK